MKKKERLSQTMVTKKRLNFIQQNPFGKKFWIADEKDTDLIDRYTWYINSSGYVACTIRLNGKNKTLLMHRMLLNPKTGKIVDHINGNKLDNRRSNIRIVNFSENQHNTHVVRKSLYGAGVYKLKGRFHSHLRNKGKWIFIGAFDTSMEAQKAYWSVKNKFLPASQQR